SEQPMPQRNPKIKPRSVANPKPLGILLSLHGHHEAVFSACDRMIQRIALHGNPSSLSNQAAEFLSGHPLRSGRAGIVVDLFLDDRAIQVVGPKAESNLRD